MSDVRAHSFDAPRERVVPTVVTGRGVDGLERRRVLTRRTLVVAVKPHCDGCDAFVHGDLAALGPFEVVVVSASAPADSQWDGATQEVLVAPEFMAQVGILAAPYYVLVDPGSARTLYEGVLFSPEQVATEIAGFLTT